LSAGKKVKKRSIAVLLLFLASALSLDQTLVAATKDETQWMINNNLSGERQIPDFLNYICEDGLKAIRPEAVNIIR
jgi:hypothetical protein